VAIACRRGVGVRVALWISNKTEATELAAEDETPTEPLFALPLDQLILDWPNGIVERAPANAEWGERDGAEGSPATVAPDALAQAERRQEPTRSLHAPAPGKLSRHAV
jgi:hypothetical protein